MTKPVGMEPVPVHWVTPLTSWKPPPLMAANASWYEAIWLVVSPCSLRYWV